MRFASLKLARYGRFQDCDLVFKDSEIDLQLILGPNEAGKSTTRAAVTDLLFGFKERTRFAFRFDQTALRVGAVIEAGETSLDVRRKKGRVNTLLTPSDEVADQGLLDPYLAGQTRETFERMFSLDHERLREGGRLMLDNKNDVGAALFAAGSGLTHIVQSCDDLEKVAKGIWARNAGEGRPLNKAFSDYQQGKQSLREVEVRPSVWSKAKRHLEAITKGLETLKLQRAELTKLQRQVQRQQLVRGPMATLERAKQRLSELGTVPDVPHDMATRVEKALETAQRARVEIGLANEELERLNKDIASEEPCAALLAVEAELDALRELKGVVDQAAASLPSLTAELEVVQTRVGTTAAELGKTSSTSDALRAALPDFPTIEELKGLIERWSGIEEQLRTATASATEAKANVERLEALVSEFPRGSDVGPLQDLLRTYRPAGLTAAREEAERASDELRKHSEAALRKLAPWSGDIEALRALALPPFDDIQSALSDLVSAQDELKAAREGYDRELVATEQLELDRTQAAQINLAPSRSALEAARDVRSQLWAPLHRHILGEAVIEEPARAASAFEAAVSESDRLADERFAGAEQSGVLAALERDIERAKLKLDQARRRRDQAQGRVLECQQAFAQLVSPCGFEASPTSYVTWHDDRLDVLERADAADLAEAGAIRARSAEAAACAQLRAVLGTDDRSLASLGALLTEAERAVEVAAEARARLRDLEVKLEAAVEASSAAERQLARATSAHADWLKAWAAALKSAGLPDGTSVAACRAKMELIEELRTDLQLLVDRSASIQAANASISEFERRLADASKAAGLGAAEDAAAQYAELQAQISNARRQADRVQTLLRQAAEVTSKKALREEALSSAEALLEPFFSFCSGREASDLRAMLRRAQEAAQLRDDLRRIESEILGHGEGRCLETLLDEASSADADALADEAARIAEDLDEIAPLIDAKSEERSAAELDFRALNDGPDAAIASFGIAEARTEMAFYAEQYIRRRTEARVLRTVIERYRQLKQGPLLARASELFAKLTLGAFTRLAVDYDDETPTLKGVRSEDAPYLGLEGMSEGTIDQLYLALRIAAVEVMIAQGARLPFLADDLFINFDEERAAAGFRVLGELARKTQVLFFTHHAHLARVADDALRPAQVSVCGLDRDQATLSTADHAA